MAVRAAVCLASTGIIVHKDLLARVGWVPSTPPVGIASYITVSVADVVLVLRVEFVIGKPSEGLPPE